MYFKRNIDQYLLEWKDSQRRKPLLVRGARQVGKSSSIRHLGESFDYYVEINFETRPEYRQIFIDNKFLFASGHGHWVEAKSKATYSAPLPPELHNALVSEFRSFLIVGGMPASVSAWIDTHDYLQCTEELEDIGWRLSYGGCQKSLTNAFRRRACQDYTTFGGKWFALGS